MRFRCAMLALIVISVGCGQRRISDDQGNIAVERKWESQDSRIRQPEYVRVTNREDWATLWDRHTGQPEKTPKVDFEKDMVLAVFAGEAHNVSELKLVSLTEERELIRLRFARGALADDAYYDGLRPQFLAALYRIPRSDKKVVFEEEQTDLQTGQSLGVEQVAELPAL